MSRLPSYERSFATHEKAKYWSKKNEKDPRNVFKQSHAKYWFDCDKCNHDFESILSNIARGPWCPYCNNKKICENLECIQCFNKSFASHENAQFWSKENGDVNPRAIFKSSHTKYVFECDKCKHSFDKGLNSVVRGQWCPYCTHQKLCENKDCVICFDNSFASHEKAKFWSEKNGGMRPRAVFKQSSIKYWFDCDKCKDGFDCVLYSIVAGSWCPYCKNKTELKLYDALNVIYPSIIRQFKQEWCKKQMYLPFDFCIPELKIIIELDGIQHFVQVSNWASPEETYENDLFKEKCANENGYSVIRIIQEDVFNDTYDWLAKIVSSIEEIKISGNIENHYLCENNEYDNFIVADKPKLIVGA
jgi:very-short-patch-repair endonuclease